MLGSLAMVLSILPLDCSKPRLWIAIQSTGSGIILFDLIQYETYCGQDSGRRRAGSDCPWKARVYGSNEVIETADLGCPEGGRRLRYCLVLLLFFFFFCCCCCF